MSAHHGHNHLNDDESHGRNVTSKKNLLWALSLTGTFMVVEVIGGIVSGSLALLADAGHMLTDTAALLLAYSALYFASKPADNKRTFGYGRLQVLAAYTNGVFLVLLTGWIVWEAIHRFIEPNPIQSASMFTVAVIGLIVNLLVFKILHSAGESNINIRSALLHVLGDLLGSVGAIIAAITIWIWGLLWVDPLLSIFVAVLILRSAYYVIKDASHILLEGIPIDISMNNIRSDLMSIKGVEDIHHMHAWSLSEDEPMMTFHALVDSAMDSDYLLEEMLLLLKKRHGVGHATIQIEVNNCQLGEEGCKLD
ncbi:cation diffusion facilitator family transporter [Kangiella koreensis]|uniref:Cation diffusion facilitator family transporter n=1 Tax=Kangiella koreensis (strain DSM 16069 / JCM 12317 / KCTC 12182 / SW-125) TaxID=523791 RepID=C7R8M3_KANKD|nr:cation diffusion facilitator family transporter [Kangiella koreensis]ACV25886.1 cation diffusion facilitator family transporter [Kangiella koreensis DSM 16069]